MNPGRSLVIACFCVAAIANGRGQGTIEGRVELPKTQSAPVMTKRYEVVTKGGVLSTDPPIAVVYVETSGARPARISQEAGAAEGA